MWRRSRRRKWASAEAETARRNRKRADQGEIMDDQTREKYLISPWADLAFGLDLARRAGQLLSLDDLRHLCGAGHLLDRRSEEPGCQSQPDRFHHLVERRACTDHGGAGPFRHSGTWSPRWRCSGPAGSSGHSLVSLAERGMVRRRRRLALSTCPLVRAPRPADIGIAGLEKPTLAIDFPRQADARAPTNRTYAPCCRAEPKSLPRTEIDTVI